MNEINDAVQGIFDKGYPEVEDRDVAFYRFRVIFTQCPLFCRLKYAGLVSIGRRTIVMWTMPIM